jgi:hypothetical protein
VAITLARGRRSTGIRVFGVLVEVAATLLLALITLVAYAWRNGVILPTY